MNILEALQWRYAVKKFSDEKVTKSALRTLLDATRLSASSYGLQPYKIIVVESADIRTQLLPFSYGQNKVAESSHLIVLAAHTNVGNDTVDCYINKHAQVTHNSVEGLSNFSDFMKSALSVKTPEEKQEWAHQQAYIALGNLLTCAAAMQIDTCPMTGFDRAGYDVILDLTSKKLTATAICPIGYRHESDAQADSPKVRFDYNEIVVEM